MTLYCPYDNPQAPQRCENLRWEIRRMRRTLTTLANLNHTAQETRKIAQDCLDLGEKFADL